MGYQPFFLVDIRRRIVAALSRQRKIGTHKVNARSFEVQTKWKYIIYVVAIYYTRIERKERAYGPLRPFFSGCTRRACVLAPERHATPAGTKTRAAQAQPGAVQSSEGPEIKGICI